MGTYDPDEILDEEQIKTSRLGMSRCVFTKKYNPDGTFNKLFFENQLKISLFLFYKCRTLFRGDIWCDLYHNKTYAGCVCPR